MAARRPRTPAPRPPQPSREDRYWAGFYGELMQRYQEVAAVWAVPMMAVRIYAKRVGLDTMLKKLVLHGAPTVAERCRNELTVRQIFLATMLTNFPPGDPQDIQEAIEEMANDLATIDSEQGAMIMLRYLDRVRTREIMLKARNGTVH